MRSNPETATVTIYRVTEAPTKTGLRRFTIEAQAGGRYLSFTTLNEWKASVCDQAQKAGLPLLITFRDTGYFDKDIVNVERVAA